MHSIEQSNFQWRRMTLLPAVSVVMPCQWNLITRWRLGNEETTQAPGKDMHQKKTARSEIISPWTHARFIQCQFRFGTTRSKDATRGSGHRYERSDRTLQQPFAAVLVVGVEVSRSSFGPSTRSARAGLLLDAALSSCRTSHSRNWGQAGNV